MKLEQFATLADRLADIRILREHHVWHAAAILDLETFGDRESPLRRRFQSLMDADALLDAVLLLAEACDPPRSIDAIRHQGEHWICAMRGPAACASKARHADLAAAVLISFLDTFTHAPALRRPTRANTRQPNRTFLHEQ